MKGQEFSICAAFWGVGGGGGVEEGWHAPGQLEQ
jgi:hypothetical protein